MNLLNIQFFFRFLMNVFGKTYFYLNYICQCMMPLSISTLSDKRLAEKNTHIDVLRLDLWHPEISGNKWFKLKYNLEQAQKEKKKNLLSFGGAYSNHLHALAFAGKEFSFNTVGIIRGEEVMNDTLSDCKKWGMELHFIPRNEYKDKYNSQFLEKIQSQFPHHYLIPEGGNNALGLQGCKEILKNIDISTYQFIACAVGTSTTFTGLIESAYPQHHLIGFSALKNGFYLNDEIKKNTNKLNWELNHDYHFGGFAKSNVSLLEWMKHFKKLHGIELDFIYTAKMMYGLFDMIHKDEFKNGRLLAIHTGGLQGNRSLI